MNFNHNKSPISMLWFAAMTIFLVGCGGGGGGGGVTPPPATREITGKAILDGAINGADVKVHKMTDAGAAGDQLGNATKTSSDGVFTLNIPASYNGSVLIEVTGNSASAKEIPADNKITGKLNSGDTLSAALVPETDGSFSATKNAVTPFTSMAVEQVKIKYSRTVKPNNLATAISGAVTDIQNALGITDIMSPSNTGYSDAIKIFKKYMEANTSKTATEIVTEWLNAIQPDSTTISDFRSNLQAAAAAAGVSPLTITPLSSTWTISGKVSLSSGNGLQGVVLTLAALSETTGQPTGVTLSTTTNASGMYSISAIPNGYYSLTPSLKNYLFVFQDPIYPSVQINGADKVSNITAMPDIGSGGITIPL